MQSPLLSVIVPVFRCEFLREAIESAQRSDIELIFVDDGSTDETADIARTLGPSIIYIRQDNAGPAAARNRGLEIARGRFIAFLDADDVWAETHPANALRYLQQHPDVDLVLGRVELLTQNRASGKFEATGKSFSTYQLGAAVARRELFEKVGGFNPKMRYGEDVDWFLRVRESSAATSILNETALYYRLHASNQPHVYERSRTGLLDAFHKSLIRRRESAPVAMHDSSTRPLISVVLPVFNCESYIADAIASVVAQDYRPLELIVVDDGSTDRTREIVREIPEATVLEQPHRGAGAARNEGVRAAKGELIAFIDADDLWIQNKLTTQVNALNADASLEAVFAHLTEFRGDDHAQSDAIAAPMLGTMLIKRASFERVGPFDDDEKTLEGFDWYLRASEKSLRSEILPDVLYQRRIHSANRSVAHRDLNGYLRAIKTSLDRRRAAGNFLSNAD